VADIVEESRDPQRLDDEALRREWLTRRQRRERAAERRLERPRPLPGEVHDPQPVGEARVLSGREDPARALELADPAEALQPGRVEQVVLGRVLVREPGGGRFAAGQALRELDVAVDRVADEVDRRERVARGAARGQGTQIRTSGVQYETLPRQSRDRTRNP
jgi:hypothetical protein